jgi:quercetin dioxygenase-like cupin family protein
MIPTAKVYRWSELPCDHPLERIDRRRVIGQQMMISLVTLHKGFQVGAHAHPNEQFSLVTSGRVRFTIADAAGAREVVLGAGELIHLPGDVMHAAEALETSELIDLFSPPSEKTGVDKPDS